ncbi:hypothetical protein LRS13_21840 [Svornostia abyssi]|uniref:Ribosomal protein L7/L12 C-terminal domain-containing protein n=1 Tax=Svornostia abyssi TaxID=2898438 RepID=A0ABY5PF68_9ACTN|nr:hypothetical protein LRS13_21840 [Parviterribacteraceae bacterium J379]
MSDLQAILARLDAIEQRLATVERKVLDPLPAGTAGPISIDGQPAGVGGDVSAEVRGMAQNGQLIQAIKLHREQTGLGLAEAKAVVERYAR